MALARSGLVNQSNSIVVLGSNDDGVNDRHWDGIAAYCRSENKVSLGFVEGLNGKIRVLQRRAYGLRDEEYLRLKILTSMLPEL